MELAFHYADHWGMSTKLREKVYEAFVTNGVERQSGPCAHALSEAIDAMNNGGDFGATFAVHWQKYLKQREHHNQWAREHGALLRQEAKRKRREI